MVKPKSIPLPRVKKGLFEDLSLYEDDKFYDEIYKRTKQYRGKPSDSGTYKVWNIVIRKINERGWKKILDLGCGPGQFGLLCMNKGWDYSGVDFSEEAITLARNKVKGSGKSYIHSNIFEFVRKFGAYEHDVVTMIEVLEHVKKDIKLLQMLPPGQNVVITIPNYPANNHVRYFAEITSVIERYRGVVEILDLETFTSKGTPDNSIFVIVGKIRNVRLNHIKDVKKVIGPLPSTIDVTSIIEECVTLGSNCDVGPGCIIGGKSVGAEFDEVGDLIEFPQCGKVIIKDNVKIRSRVVIDRSTNNSTATVIEDNCIIGPMAHIGHNVKVGRNSMVLGNSVICGGAEIGERCTIGAGSIIKNKVKIGDGSIVGLGAVVTKDVPGGWVVTGNPSRKLAQ